MTVAELTVSFIKATDRVQLPRRYQIYGSYFILLKFGEKGKNCKTTNILDNIQKI